jgi:hypothetical protein
LSLQKSRRGSLAVSSIFVVFVASLVASRCAAGVTTEPDPAAKDAAMQNEIDQLKQRIDVLEAEKSPTTEPIPAASPSNQPFNLSRLPLLSGYAPSLGFVLRSSDGQFSFHPGIVIDARYMANYREDLSPTSGSEVSAPRYSFQSGFDISRFRMTFDGNITKYINYFVQFQDDQGTTFNLLDAFITYRWSLDSPFAIRVGQFKDPVWHERNISEASQLAVDRSLLEFLVGGGQTARVQGISGLYDQDRFRGQLVFHDGFNSGNTKFIDAGGIGAGVGAGAGVSPTDYGVTCRAEYMVLGNRTADFNPFSEYDRGFTSLGAQQNILVLGAGADYSEAGSNNVTFHTVDAQYNRTNGFSAYAAYLGSYRDLHHFDGVPVGFYYMPGFLVQMAYLVTPKIEPYIRYDYLYIPPASAPTLATGQVQEITVGANYYLYKQNAKITVDGIWLPQGSPTDADALGILKNSGNNEFVLRVQFQLAI